MVSNFIVQALRGEDLTVYGDGAQTRSFCYVDDLVEGLVRLMQRDGLTGPVNLGNPVETTILEFARRIIELTGSRSQDRAQAAPRGRPEAAPAGHRAWPARLLGWEPKVPLETGLRKTIDYFAGLLRKG